MPLPQDIRPVFQDIQDTLVRSDAPWIERSPRSRQGAVDRPGDRHLGPTPSLEEGPRRAAAQASCRRPCLYHVG